MRILIANDDGIYSPGLLALAEVAKEFAEVRIYAPDVEQSSMGHAITHSRPLSLRRTPIRDFEAYRVNGTPADCVALGAACAAAAHICGGDALAPRTFREFGIGDYDPPRLALYEALAMAFQAAAMAGAADASLTSGEAA